MVIQLFHHKSFVWIGRVRTGLYKGYKVITFLVSLIVLEGNTGYNFSYTSISVEYTNDTSVS
jgi:hypothetical protein